MARYNRKLVLEDGTEFYGYGFGASGDAAAMTDPLIGSYGICLGHQILALSYGAKTDKLKLGHRGGNHPVKNLKTGKVEITSQNHSYAVDGASLEGTGLSVTHVNLLDGAVEGLENARDGVLSVRHHPESAPGSQDSAYLFGHFIAAMEGKRYAEANGYS